MIDRTTDYARKVVSGEILASKKNIQSCQRHLDNMELKVTKYHFDVEKAEAVINFIELLPVPKTMKQMKLKQFQTYIIGSLFGWIDDEGNRRFTKAYISMARKQGKTLLVAGIAMWDLLLGKEPAYERVIGVVSNSQSQANLVWADAMTQLKALRKISTKTKNKTKITPSIHELMNINDRSVIKSFSREADNLEGSQISTGIIDEAHLLKDNKVYEGIRRGQTLLKSSSLYYISTAGTNLSVPFYDEYKYITKVLDKEETNDRYFIFCAEQDSEKEIHDSSTWIKSNPLLEDEELAKVIVGNLEEEVNEGIAKGEINSLLVKSFNLWRQSSADTFIQLQDWDKGYMEDEVDITGREVYFGIDLSRQDDLSAIGIIFPMEDKKFYVDSHVFVGFKHSIQEKTERDKIDYMKLIDNGQATLTNTESGIINYEQIINWLIDYIQTHNLEVKGIMVDPWNAQSFMAKISQDYDYPLIEVGQNFKNMSPALKQFKLSVYEKKILHKGNPNLSLAINNAIVMRDHEDNIKIDKKISRNKIDALVAVAIGFTMAMHYEFDDEGFDKYVLSDDFGF